MIEKLAGSLATLGTALALKTAVMALLAPWVARYLAHMPMRRGFWISQFVGMALLLPLACGIYENNMPLFLGGLVIGGLPNLILGMVGTAYLKLSASEDVGEFRSNQGRLQLVISLCFAACTLLAPLLLRWFSYSTILGIDFLSYGFGAIYIFNQTGMEKWEVVQASPDLDRTNAGGSRLKFLSTAVLLLTVSILMTYLLKGLPPLVAGNASLTSRLGLDPTLRQTLWAFEAMAGIAAGMLYRKYHGWMDRWRLFDLGMVNGIFLLIANSGYLGLALGLFLLSASMTLTFMKLRDDFIAQFADKQEVLWATGVVNMVVNITLTLSPLLIGFAVEHAGILPSVLGAMALQMAVYVWVRIVWELPAD